MNNTCKMASSLQASALALPAPFTCLLQLRIIAVRIPLNFWILSAFHLQGNDLKHSQSKQNGGRFKCSGSLDFGLSSAAPAPLVVMGPCRSHWAAR